MERAEPHAAHVPSQPPAPPAEGAESSTVDKPVDNTVDSVGDTGDETELDERSREILRFEKQWWKVAGAKEQGIRDTFGLSATRYYQLLNGLLDDPRALAFDPVLVKRLRRLRASRSRTRR